MLIGFPGFKQKALTFSFDDGVRADLRLIPLLKKYKMKCTFNIVPSWLSENGACVSSSDLISVYLNNGTEIANHGLKHLSLAEVNSQIALYDVIKCREDLENITGIITNSMAYANGSYSDNVVDILKKSGIVYSRTVDSTKSFDIPKDFLKWHPTCHFDDKDILSICDKFNETVDDKSYYWFKTSKLLYIWGHSYELDDRKLWDKFETTLSVLANKEDVWYATNMEIYNYINAYNSLIFSLDGKLLYNPTVFDIYFNNFDTDYVVKSGETISIK